MEQNIYLDVYFGFNFLMDFFVLFLTRLLMKSSKSIIRSTMAAAIGAVYATLILVLNFTGIFASFMTYLGVAQLMLLVAFGKMKIKNNIKNLCLMYVVTFSVGGMVNMLYYATEWGRNLFEKTTENLFGNISAEMILCVMVIIVTAVYSLREKIRRDMAISRKLYPVLLKNGNEKVYATALCDTGNSLVEPITQRPVSVIERDALKFSKMENLRYVFVPYHTVGKEHGMMQAFFADRLEVNGKIVENAVIGIHEGKLSRNQMYEMILHPDIIESEELTK